MNETIKTAIGARNLRRDFGDRRVLKNVSFEVEAGNVCALLGANGTGKTTLLKLLAGLIAPSQGVSLLLGDENWPRSPAVLPRMGCLIDRFEPTASTPLRHLLDLSASVDPRFDIVRAKRLLKEHDLELHRRWGELSKGQKRWCLLVTLLCRQCDVLLLDEPADGLDPQTRREVYQLIREAVNDRGVTALVATHVISDIERVADEICILNQGEILLQAHLEELREQVHIIDLETELNQEGLPTGVELLHAEKTAPGTVWIRDREYALHELELPGEIRRRRATLEDLFLILTETHQAEVSVSNVTQVTTVSA